MELIIEKVNKKIIFSIFYLKKSSKIKIKKKH